MEFKRKGKSVLGIVSTHHSEERFKKRFPRQSKNYGVLTFLEISTRGNKLLSSKVSISNGVEMMKVVTREGYIFIIEKAFGSSKMVIKTVYKKPVVKKIKRKPRKL